MFVSDDYMVAIKKSRFGRRIFIAAHDTNKAEPPLHHPFKRHQEKFVENTRLFSPA